MGGVSSRSDRRKYKRKGRKARWPSKTNIEPVTHSSKFLVTGEKFPRPLSYLQIIPVPQFFHFFFSIHLSALVAARTQ